MAWSTAAVEGWVLAALATAGGLVGVGLCWTAALAGATAARATAARATGAGVAVRTVEVTGGATVVDVWVVPALAALASGDVVDAWAGLAGTGTTRFAAGLWVTTVAGALVAEAAFVASVWTRDGSGGSRTITPATTATPREAAAPVAHHLR